ncbi:hypothetical protein GCM10028778_01080 [Barrientosiimonas marina]
MLIIFCDASLIVIDDNAVNSSVEAELDEDDDRRIYEVELEMTDGGEAEAEIDSPDAGVFAELPAWLRIAGLL